MGMDANEDVCNGPFSQRLQDLGLYETITRHHLPISPPATQNRNRSRTPIDGIWATGTLEVTKAGYTAFGGGCPSDHRGLWIDVTTASMLGHRPPRLLQPVAHRLNSRDPRIWRKYCNNEIHSTTRLVRQDIAHKIRKVKRGEVPWSPRLQKLRSNIELWDRVVKQHEGKATSSTIIRRLALRCGKIQEVQSFTSTEATAELQEAHRRYKNAKPESPFWRTEHLHGLADALANHNNTTRASGIT